jgi:hypothetical protein
MIRESSRALLVVLVLGFCCSCDLDLIGVDVRTIAGGYRLKHANGQYSLLVPRATGGPIIDEIGWRKPIILFRSSGSEYWDVVNTDRAEHFQVNDRERKSDERYREIETTPAEIAWQHLDKRRALW